MMYSYFIDLVIYKNITYNSTLYYNCLDFYQHVHASCHMNENVTCTFKNCVSIFTTSTENL